MSNAAAYCSHTSINNDNADLHGANKVISSTVMTILYYIDFNFTNLYKESRLSTEDNILRRISTCFCYRRLVMI